MNATLIDSMLGQEVFSPLRKVKTEAWKAVSDAVSAMYGEQVSLELCKARYCKLKEILKKEGKEHLKRSG